MYDVTGQRGGDEFLAVACGSRRDADAAAELARTEGWQEVSVTEADTELAWRCGVTDALRALFPDDVAAAIEEADAFGALVHRVRERAREYDHTPAEVLGAVDEEDRAFAGRADEPAAFLAAKVRDLPEPAAAEDAGSTEGQEETGDVLPREVAEVIDAVRTFTDTVARVGAEEFAETAGLLRKAELAWVLDRLDDVRQDVAGVLEELTDPMQRHGANISGWNETLGDLESAGDGLYQAIQGLDPEGERHGLVHLYEPTPPVSEGR